jgi:hypothetical protein
MSTNGSNLQCIFLDIMGCQQSNFDDSDAWSEHIIEHFGPSGPPPHALCIFCERSFEHENAIFCWNEYLEHITIKHPQRVRSLLNRRPDFRVLKYLRDNGRITEEEYADFCAIGSERPMVDGLIPLDREPDELVAKREAEDAASNRIIISDPRRGRDRQRPTRGKKPSSTVILL